MRRGPKVKTAAERAAVAAVRARDGQCVHLPPCACDRAGEPHHVWRSGQGGPWADWNLVVLCHQAHRWVHDHPLASASLGLLIPSWTAEPGARAAAELRELYRAGEPTFAPWLDADERTVTVIQLPEFYDAPILAWVGPND